MNIIEPTLIVYEIISLASIFVSLMNKGVIYPEKTPNPLIYIFWPIVAINALLLHIRESWTK